MDKNAEMWQNYAAAVSELEKFETAADGTKYGIVRKIRDTVAGLVTAGQIAIRRDQIAHYVRNMLIEKNIKHSKSQFYGCFSADQKRNYAASPASDFHDHSWKTVSAGRNGRWEMCGCGANRLNGIVNEPLAAPKQDRPQTVSEIERPECKEFAVLDRWEKIARNNIRLIRLIREKTEVNITAINRQAGRSYDADGTRRLRTAREKAKRRLAVFVAGFKNHRTAAKKADGVITRQMQAVKYLDDRLSVMYWEKVMANFAVSVGYDTGTVADTLHVTSKHIRENVVQKKFGASDLLHDLEWFGRCPACGVVLRDYVERHIRDFREGRPLKQIRGYELEMIVPTSYQRQVVRLKRALAKKTGGAAA